MRVPALDARLFWILDAVAVYGFVARDHLVRRFGLSARQASADLAEAARRHPDRLQYNAQTRRYEGQPRRLPSG